MKYFAILLFLASFTAACSNKVAVPQSTMHTEPLHKKWIIQKMDGADILREFVTKPYVDIKDVYHAYAIAGCNKIIFTPKFGHQNRIEFAHLQVSEKNCKGATLADAALFKNLSSSQYWLLSGNTLLLKNNTGRIIIEAIAEK